MKRFLQALLGTGMCLCLASAVTLAAPGRDTQRTSHVVTVGDFAMQLAKAVTGRTVASPESAAAFLRDSGIVIRGNLNRSLTQGDVVNLLSQAGIKVTAKDPSQPVDKGRADTIISTFNADLGRGKKIDTAPCVGCDSGTGQNPNDDFNNGNGTGGKFKRKKKNSQNGSD